MSDDFSIHASGRVIRVVRWTGAVEQALADPGITQVVIPEQWDAGQAGFARLPEVAPHVEGMTLATVPRGWEAIHDLPALSRLRLEVELRALDWARLQALRDASLSYKGAPGRVGQVPRLERLLLSMPVTDLACLEGATSLQFLNVVDCGRLRTLAGIAHAPRLEELWLRYLPKLESVAEAARLPALRRLSLVAARKVADLDALAAAPALAELYLELGPELRSFEALGRMPALEVLTMQRQAFAPSVTSIAPLARSRTLRRFAVDFSKLAPITDLGALGAIPTLEALELSRTGPIATLRDWIGFPRLRTLTLGGKVKDGDLTPLLALPMLAPSEGIYPYPFKHPAGDDRLPRLLRPDGPPPPPPAPKPDAVPGLVVARYVALGSVGGATIENAGELFVGAPCEGCGSVTGGRSDVPVRFHWSAYRESYCHGAIAREEVEGPLTPATRWLRLYSEPLLAALEPRERDCLTIRPAIMTGKGRHAMFEVVGATRHVEPVVLPGDARDVETCDRCGRPYDRSYGLLEWLPAWARELPEIRRDETRAKAFLDAALIGGLPPAFAMGDVEHGLSVVIPAARWAELRARHKPVTTGVGASFIAAIDLDVAARLAREAAGA